MLDTNISLIPFLILDRTTLKKKHLTMSFYLFKHLISLHWFCLQYRFISTSERTFPLVKPVIIMYCIHELMRPIKTHDYSGVCHEMPPVVTAIVRSLLNLKTPPLFLSCQLMRSMYCIPKVDQ